jgi:hypothetical protein
MTICHLCNIEFNVLDTNTFVRRDKYIHPWSTPGFEPGSSSITVGIAAAVLPWHHLTLKKSDAIIVRLNTFHIFQTSYMESILRRRNSKILSMQFCFSKPKCRRICSTIEYIRLSKLPFCHSESKFVWEIPLGFKISKFLVRS